MVLHYVYVYYSYQCYPYFFVIFYYYTCSCIYWQTLLLQESFVYRFRVPLINNHARVITHGLHCSPSSFTSCSSYPTWRVKKFTQHVEAALPPQKIPWWPGKLAPRPCRSVIINRQFCKHTVVYFDVSRKNQLATITAQVYPIARPT